MVYIKKSALLLCMLTLIAGCAAGRSAFNKAEKFEREGKLDDAVVKYAEAASANPDVGEYRLRLLKASEKAALKHFQKGEEYFGAKLYDDALREFQTSFTLDPSFDRAKQMSDKTSKIRTSLFYYNEGVALERDRKPREAIFSYQKALDVNSENKEAKEAVERLTKSRKTRLDGTELNLKSNKPITLKFKDAKIKEVFNILSQLSGINFIFDEGLKDQNVSIYLENATFQQALDILTGINKLGKKILNESTIIIYPKNPEKTKQYEELYVKTFFLNKLEAKKAVNLIRTMLQVKKIYVNEDMNALVIRDTPQVIEVAQKILDANDVPDAELVLEVEVMEIAKSNTENFGLVLSKYFIQAAGASNGSSSFLADTLPTSITQTTTPGTTTTTTTSTTPDNLLQFFKWNGYGGFLTVPNATFNFAKTLSNGETLANPRLRVKNREKAKFNVGQRVPITTTSSPTTGGISVNVQYVDVGVKLNAEPVVQLNNEITMKVSLEVSSIVNRQTVGTDQATTVVTIGTRNLDTVLSLKDGETSIIGGLIRDDKTTSKQKIYILGDIPVIGPLFSGNSKNRDKSELILAITPHIVRGLTVPESDVTGFWSGKEDDPSVSKLYPSFQETETMPAVAPGAPSGPQAAAPAATAIPAARPPVQRPVVTPPAAVPPAATAPVLPAPTTPSAPSGQVPAVSPRGTSVSPTAPMMPALPAITAPAPAVPAGKSTAPAAPAAKTPAPVTPGAPAPVPVAPGAKAPAAAAVAGVPVSPSVAPSLPAPAPKASAQTPARTTVSVMAPKSVKRNDQFKVDVQVNNVADLYKAPFTMVYDPIFVEFVGATEGAFLQKDGKPTIFKTTVDKNIGQISVNLARVGDVEGISGSGPLMTATFKAKNQGPASFGFLGVNLADRKGKVQEAIPFNTVVDVK